MVVSRVVERIFNETAARAKAVASNHLAKANRASYGPRAMAKERVRKVRESPTKDNAKVPEVRTRVKPRKLVYPVLKTLNQRQVQKLRNLSGRIPLPILARTLLGVMMAGVTTSGMMTEVRLDGMKVGIKPMTIPQAHCHLEVLILVP